MKVTSLFVIAFTCSLGVMSVSAQAKEKDKWVCMKDGAEVKVKGKKPEDKEKDCTANGGTWEKAEHGDKQSSGSGGAW
jgi:hypothetical protein